MAVIAIPISLQSMITIGVNMTDTVMVGKLGETSLSATALANQFVNIYQICCMGIAMGARVNGKRHRLPVSLWTPSHLLLFFSL